MNHTAIILLIFFSGLCTIRLIRGPSLLDRVAAADAIGVMMTAVLVLLGIVFERIIFLDIAIVYAMLLFADTIIIVKFIEHRDVA
ncbi:MAG: sodium:proton antiporter [Spirochaetaceae bacterium]|nr:MAG: sodium:proton antiporter [Spirochaetaceae bacterium]